MEKHCQRLETATTSIQPRSGQRRLLKSLWKHTSGQSSAERESLLSEKKVESRTQVQEMVKSVKTPKKNQPPKFNPHRRLIFPWDFNAAFKEIAKMEKEAEDQSQVQKAVKSNKRPKKTKPSKGKSNRWWNPWRRGDYNERWKSSIEKLLDHFSYHNQENLWRQYWVRSDPFGTINRPRASTHSIVSLEKARKFLMFNGGPWTYSKNHGDKDDEPQFETHLVGLTLIMTESEPLQYFACSLCNLLHPSSWFEVAELAKPGLERKCRTVYICPHGGISIDQFRAIGTRLCRGYDASYKPLKDRPFSCHGERGSCKFSDQVSASAMIWQEQLGFLYLTSTWSIRLRVFPQCLNGSNPGYVAKEFSDSNIRLCPHLRISDVLNRKARCEEWEEEGWGKKDIYCSGCGTLISAHIGDELLYVTTVRFFGAGKSGDEWAWAAQMDLPGENRLLVSTS